MVGEAFFTQDVHRYPHVYIHFFKEISNTLLRGKKGLG